MSASPAPVGRMLLSGFTVAAGSATNFACARAGIDPGVGLLATSAIISSLVSIAGSSLATDAHTVLDRPVPDPDSRRWNHDILRASVLAVSDIIKKEAKQRNQATATSLLTLADAVSTHYDEIDDDDPLAVVTEAEVRENLRKGDSFQHEPSGNAETWTAFLHHIAQDIQDLPNIPQNVMEELGTAICKGFNNQLFQILKFDFDAEGSPIKGRAYAAVTLDLLKHLAHGNDKILTLIETLSPKIDSIKDDITAIRSDVAEIRKTHIDPAAATERLRKEIKETAAAKFAELKAASAPVAEIANIHAIRDKQLADLEDLVARLTRDYESGDAGPIYQEALEILLRPKNGGIDQALEFLQLMAAPIREKIAASSQKLSRSQEQTARAEEDLARDLRPLFYEAELLEQKLDYYGALKVLREACTMAPNSWEALDRLGVMSLNLALMSDAEDAFNTALNLAKGTENEGTALNNLAQLLNETNRLYEAEPLMRRAVTVYETSYGREHPHVAAALNNLGQLLQATSRLGEAESLMREALSIIETTCVGNHPNVVFSLTNLAGLLQTSNRPLMAEPLLRRALTIAEEIFGEQHPHVAICLNNLSQILQDTNRLLEAEPLVHRALSIDEASFGINHPKIATRLSNLGQLLQATGRIFDAETHMRRALSLIESSLDENHPTVAIALNNLATLLQATDRLAEAEPLMRRHLVILIMFAGATGHDHPHLKAAARNYGGLLLEMEIKNPEFSGKLATLGPEAGWEVEEWDAKLKELLESK